MAVPYVAFGLWPHKTVLLVPLEGGRACLQYEPTCSECVVLHVGPPYRGHPMIIDAAIRIRASISPLRASVRFDEVGEVQAITFTTSDRTGERRLLEAAHISGLFDPDVMFADAVL